jgi:hypothetical protein
MDKAEFDEMITTLADWVDTVRHNRQFTSEYGGKVIVALLKSWRLASQPEYESLNLLPQLLVDRSFDEALKILKNIKMTYTVKQT